MRATDALMIVALAGAHVGCAGDPCDQTLGVRGMIGCKIAVGNQPELDDKFTGFLVGSDKRGHWNIGWIDSLGAPTIFSGTVSVDGAIDPTGTHGHTGTENVHFDTPGQISFDSAPGATLAGVDLTTDSDSIYLDGFLNGSHLGFAARFETHRLESYPTDFDTDWDPVAFTPE
jgi:hypothetical protein